MASGHANRAHRPTTDRKANLAAASILHRQRQSYPSRPLIRGGQDYITP
jgi:hypothetical protein